jgi:hypothetical protein
MAVDHVSISLHAPSEVVTEDWDSSWVEDLNRGVCEAYDVVATATLDDGSEIEHVLRCRPVYDQDSTAEYEPYLLPTLRETLAAAGQLTPGQDLHIAR